MFEHFGLQTRTARFSILRYIFSLKIDQAFLLELFNLTKFIAQSKNRVPINRIHTINSAKIKLFTKCA